MKQISNGVKNKKILFLILLTSIFGFFPFISLASQAEDFVASVAVAFIVVSSSIVVIGWIIAGILWLLSGGSPEKTGTAKKATWAAVIGTALVVIAILAEDIIAGLLGL